jgi:hypothetical protein
MSGERRFSRERRPTSLAQAFGIALMLLLCGLGIYISLAVLPAYDSWTPSQLLSP